MTFLAPLPRFFAISLLFALAYCQAPLYYSNQNQYFLHGLARADYGLLSEDWLANTADPTPLFSTLVSGTGRYLSPTIFYLYHGLLLGIYASSLLSVFTFLAGKERADKQGLWFFALLTAFHAAVFRWLSYRLVAFDYPWFFQAGLAGQYVLGGMLQPSVFGVLLLVAIAAFLQGRIYVAAIMTALAGTIHSTYLLPGALLTLGFLTALIAEKEYRQAFSMGGLTLLLVLPVTYYVASTFRPTSPEDFESSQQLLAHIRIPHHCLPHVWLDPVAWLQIGWMALALTLTWRTRLFPVMAVPFVLGAGLTWVQVATKSNTLSLMFPWRISAILVPLATAIILTRVVALRPRPNRRLAILLLLALAGTGVWMMAAGIGLRGPEDDRPVMEFVKQTRKPGDLYLIPVKFPKPDPAKRGSLSSDFKPPAEKKTDTQIIPVDLVRFRLFTETPIYADFKAIPYKDVDVLEWYHRMKHAERLHAAIQTGKTEEALPEMRDKRITHVIEPRGKAAEVPGFKKVYADDAYEVFRIEYRRHGED